eukprot:5328243-Pyramimonas_sp.AAC.1
MLLTLDIHSLAVSPVFLLHHSFSASAPPELRCRAPRPPPRRPRAAAQAHPLPRQAAHSVPG